MSQKKFDFTVDDIIAEFDKKKTEPSADQTTDNNDPDEYDEEFSEELAPDGEYIPRHAKPAPEPEYEDISADETQPTETEQTNTSPDISDTTETPEECVGIPPESDVPQDKTDEPSPETTVSDDENAKENITISNISDDISEEETKEPSEPTIQQPSAILEGVLPTESFSESDITESGSVSSIFENGLENTDADEAEKTETADTVEILSAEIPVWGDILPDLEETVDDAIADLDSEEIEEDETVPDDDEIVETEENADDEIIVDDSPETDENSSDIQNSADSDETDDQTDELPSFEPKPITLSSEEAAEDSEKKEKKNFLKELLPWKGDSVFEMIRKVVFLVAIVIFIGAGIMLASTMIQSNKAVKDLEAIKEVVTTTAKTTIDSDGNVVTVAPTEEEEKQHNIDIMSYYKSISDKVVGFIELEGCDIYQPVVQDPEDTANSYYLTHTYYDEQNKGGAIFMDYRCTISENYVSPNIVLYGHNQEDGTMFGNLKNYKQNLEFYAQNPAVTLRTEYESGTYLIYAYFVTNALANQDSQGVVFHYHDYIEALKDKETFEWYMGEVQSRNQIISPVTAEYGDKLLVLSTCSNEFSNSRFVVFARKLRDGESVSDYDFTTASFNPYARGVDWEAIMSGETTLSEEGSSDEDEDEDSETTTKKKKKKQTTVSDDEGEDSAETTAPPDTSDEDDDGSEETTSKKKKKTTAETTEEETTEETTSKKKKTTTEATEESSSEEVTTTKKKSKKTTAETTAEETTTTKKKKTTTTAETEETTVTSVPEEGTEDTATVTADSEN